MLLSNLYNVWNVTFDIWNVQRKFPKHIYYDVLKIIVHVLLDCFIRVYDSSIRVIDLFVPDVVNAYTSMITATLTWSAKYIRARVLPPSPSEPYPCGYIKKWSQHFHDK